VIELFGFEAFKQAAADLLRPFLGGQAAKSEQQTLGQIRL